MKTRVSCILYLVSAVLMAAVMFTGCPNDGGGEEETPATIAVTGLTLSGAQGTGPTGYTLSVPKGSPRTLTAVIEPTGASNQTVTWTTSAASTVTVTPNATNSKIATVTAAPAAQVNATAKITAKVGTLTVECTVTVLGTEVKATDVTISGPTQGNSSTLLLGGATVTLTAALAPATTTTTSVTWSIASSAIATVTPNPSNPLQATVSAVAVGNTTVKAIADDDDAAEGEYTIVVTDQAVDVTSVALSPTTLTLGKGEASAALTVTIQPPNATNTAVTWSSANDTIATVSEGVVTGVGVGGPINITVTTVDGSKTATCAVTVTYARNSVEVSVDGTELVNYYPDFKKGTGWNSGLGGGTENPDGSYTFADGSADPTENNYNSGGGNYFFPEPPVGASWSIEDFDTVEIFFEVAAGEATTSIGIKRANGSDTPNDLQQYPTGQQYHSFAPTGAAGLSMKIALLETNNGVGFQRFRGGPTTVFITKAVFKNEGKVRTITFDGGEYGAMNPIDPIKIMDGRTVNFGTNYTMPPQPERPEYSFDRWYNNTDSVNFSAGTAITKDLSLSALWIEGEKELEIIDVDVTNVATTHGAPPNNDWYPDLATATVDTDGILTLEFDTTGTTGNPARQRAIILFTDEQAEKITAGTKWNIEIKGSIEGAVRVAIIVDTDTNSGWNFSSNLPALIFNENGIFTAELNINSGATTPKQGQCGIIVQKTGGDTAEVVIEYIKVTIVE